MRKGCTDLVLPCGRHGHQTTSVRRPDCGMNEKENKAEQVREKKAEYVFEIKDPKGRVPTPEQLARAICIAADKKAGITRRNE